MTNEEIILRIAETLGYEGEVHVHTSICHERGSKSPERVYWEATIKTNRCEIKFTAHELRVSLIGLLVRAEQGHFTLSQHNAFQLLKDMADDPSRG